MLYQFFANLEMTPKTINQSHLHSWITGETWHTGDSQWTL